VIVIPETITPFMYPAISRWSGLFEKKGIVILKAITQDKIKFIGIDNRPTHHDFSIQRKTTGIIIHAVLKRL